MTNILEIKKYPDKILRVKCSPVEIVDDKIRSILSDMAFTMHSYNGIGLAAPQIGIDKQIAVVDIGEGLISLINPEIIDKNGRSAIEEGCLSLPEILLKVKRADSVKVKALDGTEKEVTIDAKGLLSTVIQHEIDHVNGTLIIDYSNFIKREFLKRKLRKGTLCSTKRFREGTLCCTKKLDGVPIRI